jgi:hypothetical protein
MDWVYVVVHHGRGLVDIVFQEPDYDSDWQCQVGYSGERAWEGATHCAKALASKLGYDCLV